MERGTVRLPARDQDSGTRWGKRQDDLHFQHHLALLPHVDGLEMGNGCIHDRSRSAGSPDIEGDHPPANSGASRCGRHHKDLVTFKPKASPAFLRCGVAVGEIASGGLTFSRVLGAWATTSGLHGRPSGLQRRDVSLAHVIPVVAIYRANERCFKSD